MKTADLVTVENSEISSTEGYALDLISKEGKASETTKVSMKLCTMKSTKNRAVWIRDGNELDLNECMVESKENNSVKLWDDGKLQATSTRIINGGKDCSTIVTAGDYMKNGGEIRLLGYSWVQGQGNSYPVISCEEDCSVVLKDSSNIRFCGTEAGAICLKGGNTNLIIDDDSSIKITPNDLSSGYIVSVCNRMVW